MNSQETAALVGMGIGFVGFLIYALSGFGTIQDDDPAGSTAKILGGGMIAAVSLVLGVVWWQIAGRFIDLHFTSSLAIHEAVIALLLILAAFLFVGWMMALKELLITRQEYLTEVQNLLGTTTWVMAACLIPCFCGLAALAIALACSWAG
ncbi:MAG: hypothetical protein ABH810_01810 [bacterium]